MWIPTNQVRKKQGKGGTYLEHHLPENLGSKVMGDTVAGAAWRRVQHSGAMFGSFVESFETKHCIAYMAMEELDGLEQPKNVVGKRLKKVKGLLACLSLLNCYCCCSRSYMCVRAVVSICICCCVNSPRPVSVISLPAPIKGRKRRKRRKRKVINPLLAGMMAIQIMTDLKSKGKSKGKRKDQSVMRTNFDTGPCSFSEGAMSTPGVGVQPAWQLRSSADLMTVEDVAGKTERREVKSCGTRQ